MGGVISLVVLGLIGAGAAIAILYGTAGEANRWPAVGSYRGRAGGFGMTWWRGRGHTDLPDADTALAPHYDLLTVDHRLEEARRRAAHGSRRGRSWMNEPGAMERAGLVDEPPGDHPIVGRPPSSPPGNHPRHDA